MFSLWADAEIELRLQDLTQAETQFTVIDANRAHIGEHLGWAHKHLSVEDTRTFIRGARRAFAELGDYGTAIYYQGQFVGGTGIHVRDPQSRKAEIGYWLAQNVNGKGIMTRAVRTLVNFGFTTMGMNRIYIRAATHNTRSAAIPERLGFTYEGTLRSDGWVHDHSVDLKIYGMLASEWTPTSHDPDFWWRVDDDIVVRPFRLADAPTLYALVDQNRAHLRPWLPWVDITTDVQPEEDFIRRTLVQYAETNGGEYGIWYDHELVGAVGYHYWDFVTRKTEIGYWLDAAATGKGIMTRTVRALTDYALTELDLNKVIIRCAPGNIASCEIPERLGFVREGTLRADQWLNDHYEDSHVYTMLAKNWTL
jgi:ribosomal-protein-serine acetyltransferase